MSSKGQVVIPKKIREKMGLNAGTSFRLQETEDGNLTLIPLNEQISKELFGICSEKHLLKDLEDEHRRERNREKHVEQ